MGELCALRSECRGVRRLRLWMNYSHGMLLVGELRVMTGVNEPQEELGVEDVIEVRAEGPDLFLEFPTPKCGPLRDAPRPKRPPVPALDGGLVGPRRRGRQTSVGRSFASTKRAAPAIQDAPLRSSTPIAVSNAPGR
jgi:hypothetical protein